MEKAKEFKKFDNIEMVGEDFNVKTKEILVQLSVSFDEDEEILDSSSDEMEIQL